MHQRYWLGPRPLTTHTPTHPLHNHSDLVFPGISSPALEEVATSRWGHRKPCVPNVGRDPNCIQCLAILNSMLCPQERQREIPGTCLPISPLRASAQLPMIPETEGQSSGDRQPRWHTPVPHEEREPWDKGWDLGRNFSFKQMGPVESQPLPSEKFKKVPKGVAWMTGKDWDRQGRLGLGGAGRVCGRGWRKRRKGGGFPRHLVGELWNRERASYGIETTMDFPVGRWVGGSPLLGRSSINQSTLHSPSLPLAFKKG